MSEADRVKWDTHYRGRDCAALAEPSPVLAEWLGCIEVNSSPPLAADVACGTGRHALYLARHGWRVEAMDISPVALARLAAMAAAEGLPITCLERDFEPSSPDAAAALPSARYDLAVMMRYTNLPLVAKLAGAIRPGGYLIAEAYLKTAAAPGGPRNPAYRVAPGEFEAAVARDFELIECREGRAHDRSGQPSAVVQVLARRKRGG